MIIIISGVLGRIGCADNTRPLLRLFHMPRPVTATFFVRVRFTETQMVEKVARPGGDRDANLPTRTNADWNDDTLTTRPPSPREAIQSPSEIHHITPTPDVSPPHLRGVLVRRLMQHGYLLQTQIGVSVGDRLPELM